MRIDKMYPIQKLEDAILQKRCHCFIVKRGTRKKMRLENAYQGNSHQFWLGKFDQDFQIKMAVNLEDTFQQKSP